MRFGTGAQFGRIANGAMPTPAPTPTPSPTPTPTPAPAPTLIDSTTGLAAFSAAPWVANNLSLASEGVPGPSGTGDATRFTSTGAFDLLFRAQSGARIMRARVKAGTTNIFTLYMDLPSFTVANFNLITGTISSGLASATMTSLGGGWWEIEARDVCAGNLGFGPEVNGTLGVNALLFDFNLFQV